MEPSELVEILQPPPPLFVPRPMSIYPLSEWKFLLRYNCSGTRDDSIFTHNLLTFYGLVALKSCFRFKYCGSLVQASRFNFTS
jgi:hypothetical protein